MRGSQEKTCCLIGHRDIRGLQFEERMQHIIQDLIEKCNVRQFLQKRLGLFDVACAGFINQAKKQYPDIRLSLVVPYYFDIESAHQMKRTGGYDDVILPDIGEVCCQDAIELCNQWMIHKSDYLLTYVVYPQSESRTAMEYAQARRKNKLQDIEIINLADEASCRKHRWRV